MGRSRYLLQLLEGEISVVSTRHVPTTGIKGHFSKMYPVRVRKESKLESSSFFNDRRN